MSQPDTPNIPLEAVLCNYTATADSKNVRAARYRGEDYLIVPLVAMVGDNVVQGMNSLGPELVPTGLLAFSVPGWNGRPVLTDHPFDGSAPANTPQTLENMSFGQIFNTKIVNGNLVTEAWLSRKQAKTLGADAQNVISRVENGEKIEVSVGAYLVMDEKSGVSGGKPYEYVWSYILPDHLAMLPKGTVGACSISAGCGTYKQKGQDLPDEKRFMSALREFIGLDPLDAEQAEVENDTIEQVVVESPPVATVSANCGCQKADSASGDGPEASPVQPTGDEMSDTKINLIGRLSANSACSLTAEQLEAASEEVLTALEASYAVVPAAKPEWKLEDAPTDVQNMVTAYKADQEAKRTSLIASLSANQTALTAEELAEKPTSELEIYAKLLPKQVSYVGQPLAVAPAPSAEEPLPMPNSYASIMPKAN